MQSRHAGITVADFVLRFAALTALTIAVLMGVAVRARDQEPVRPEKATLAVHPESAADTNIRRYPPVHSGAESPR